MTDRRQSERRQASAFFQDFVPVRNTLILFAGTAYIVASVAFTTLWLLAQGWKFIAWCVS